MEEELERRRKVLASQNAEKKEAKQTEILEPRPPGREIENKKIASARKDEKPPEEMANTENVPTKVEPGQFFVEPTQQNSSNNGGFTDTTIVIRVIVLLLVHWWLYSVGFYGRFFPAVM